MARALRACTGLPVQAENGGCGRTSWLHGEPVGPSRWQFAMPLGPPHVCCSPSTWRVHTTSLLRTKRPVQRELSTGRAALGGVTATAPIRPGAQELPSARFRVTRRGCRPAPGGHGDTPGGASCGDGAVPSVLVQDHAAA